MQEYRSLYPNHAHQLIVAPSKHYYAGQDGLLKYQEKQFDLKLTDLTQAKRKHMVIYTLRDHCSSMLYAEVCFAPELTPLRSFLARAWGIKPNTPFRGIPDVLITSRKAFDMFNADLVDDMSALNIRIALATSGFQNGIQSVFAVEKTLSYFIGKPVIEGLTWSNRFCEFDGIQKRHRTKHRKIDLWEANVGEIRELPNSFHK